jgi:hypothetical protein
MSWYKSRVVSNMLGVPYYTLFGLITRGRMAAPAKDSSGDFVWTDADVERARAALAARHQRRRAATAEAANA